mmetsp:Transcript_39590/g.99511  ORF Transcript_39590/g.99511 Transcript_39590/m.99511 type:complete len:238 (+) Transcript_39590:252-965(+)
MRYSHHKRLPLCSQCRQKSAGPRGSPFLPYQRPRSTSARKLGRLAEGGGGGGGGYRSRPSFPSYLTHSAPPGRLESRHCLRAEEPAAAAAAAVERPPQPKPRRRLPTGLLPPATSSASASSSSTCSTNLDILRTISRKKGRLVVSASQAEPSSLPTPGCTQAGRAGRRSLLATARATCMGVMYVSSYGTLCVTSSAASTAHEKTSALVSYGSCRSTSGAMYRYVPVSPVSTPDAATV